MTEETTETGTSLTKRKRKRTSHSLNPAEGGGVLLLVLLLTIPEMKTMSFQTNSHFLETGVNLAVDTDNNRIAFTTTHNGDPKAGDLLALHALRQTGDRSPQAKLNSTLTFLLLVAGHSTELD
jgi:hypothetical protein